MPEMRQSESAPRWPRQRVTPKSEVEYKREKPRGDHGTGLNRSELTSYLVATVDGLILGRVYSRSGHWSNGCKWFAEGWTPATDGITFQGFASRKAAMRCLYAIEAHGRWPHERQIMRGDER